MLTKENTVQIIGKARVADLNPGDITQHAGGACDMSCSDPEAPWRVEVVDILPDGTDVTWSHPPCGVVARPLPCGHDCLVEVWG